MRKSCPLGRFRDQAQSGATRRRCCALGGSCGRSTRPCRQETLRRNCPTQPWIARLFPTRSLRQAWCRRCRG
uniref:Uncharacterized protein n=1 Tax=uncultured marine virus TaxID=186617 RepID=A0A0F7L3D9_9VIRU|nr:hypothetical protein [uncultured marine virus]